MKLPAVQKAMVPKTKITDYLLYDKRTWYCRFRCWFTWISFRKRRYWHSGVHYQNFVRAGIGLPPVWDKLNNQIFLGDKDFVNRLQSQIKARSDKLKEIPKAQRRPLGQPLNYYVEALPSTKEGMKKAYETGDYTMQQITDALGVHYSTVSRAINRSSFKNAWLQDLIPSLCMLFVPIINTTSDQWWAKNLPTGLWCISKGQIIFLERHWVYSAPDFLLFRFFWAVKTVVPVAGCGKPHAQRYKRGDGLNSVTPIRSRLYAVPLASCGAYRPPRKDQIVIVVVDHASCPLRISIGIRVQDLSSRLLIEVINFVGNTHTAA